MSAMQQAGITHLPFVSTHGTGTPLGDPIETGAIRKAVQHPTHPVVVGYNGAKGYTASDASAPFTIAAIKTLLGHTEGTAGLAGLLLAMSHLQQQTAAPLRYRSINPYVAASMGGWPVPHRLPIQAGPADAGTHSGLSVTADGMHGAGTSSFAMSGVNAHAIVMHAASSEMPGQQQTPARTHWRRIWNFSAAVVSLTHPLLQTAMPQVRLPDSYLTIAVLTPYQTGQVRVRLHVILSDEVVVEFCCWKKISFCIQMHSFQAINPTS